MAKRSNSPVFRKSSTEWGTEMIYCFDLDKTLCSGGTTDGGYQRAKPFRARIELVNKLYDEGHTIIIDTARGSVTKIDQTKITTLQLQRWGVKYHQLRCGVKLYADFYIDDKGLSDTDFFPKTNVFSRNS